MKKLWNKFSGSQCKTKTLFEGKNGVYRFVLRGEKKIWKETKKGLKCLEKKKRIRRGVPTGVG